MATVRILLGVVWLVAAGSSWRTDRNRLSEGQRIVAIAQKEVGVKELTENSSPRIDRYNAYVGLKKVPWCASWVSWVFAQAGYTQPKTAWSPALFPVGRLIKDPVPGTVLGIYFDHLKRIGHCGIVEQVRNDWVCSIEGNTNVNGNREGDGVYRRMRHRRGIQKFADWEKK